MDVGFPSGTTLLCLFGLSFLYLVSRIRGAIRIVAALAAAREDWIRACWCKLFPRLAGSICLISVLIVGGVSLFLDDSQATKILAVSLLFSSLVSVIVAALLCVIAQYAGPEKAWRRIVQTSVGLFLANLLLSLADVLISVR